MPLALQLPTAAPIRTRAAQVERDAQAIAGAEADLVETEYIERCVHRALQAHRRAGDLAEAVGLQPNPADRREPGGRAPVPGAFVQVTAQVGAPRASRRLALAPLVAADAEGTLATAAFAVPAGGATDLEVRIGVPADTPLAIDDYTLLRLR
jgi:hypothetical protein